VPKLSCCCDAGHAHLEYSGLKDVGGIGLRLDSETAAANVLAEIEVQDPDLARADPARQLCRLAGLACIHDWHEHSPEELLGARRDVTRRYLLACRPPVALHCATLLTLAAWPGFASAAIGSRQL
jgi:hypothetical protein